MTVTDVADRVLAFRGWPFDLAELMVRIRLTAPGAGGLTRALETGEVIRSYAFRGGSYVFTPEVASVLLACRTTTRVWETRRYQQQGHFTLDDWQPWRDAVREVLSNGPAARDEIGKHIARTSALRHLAEGATGFGSDSLYKPLFWWGDICFGPSRGGQATFRLLDGDPRWPGLPDVDTAGRRSVALYLGSYGPATLDNLEYWLSDGLSVPRRRLGEWLAELGDTITSVSVDGVSAYALTSDLDRLSDAEPSHAVRLLPGYDPWILGPGTADTRLLDPKRRAMATKGANLLIRGGRVSGTWRVRGNDVAVSWFDEAGPVPTPALEAEVERIAHFRGQELNLTLAAS
jgi:Winged helix DNA-binding domain